MTHADRPFRARRALAAALAAALAVACGGAEEAGPPPALPAPAVETANARFSPLDRITRGNVPDLQVAWTYHTGELAGGAGPEPGRQVAGFQTRPIASGGFLYLTTPTSKVIALDAATGAERWRFDPQAGAARPCEEPHRGVAWWDGPGPGEGTIFSGTCRGTLIALDARTGRPRAGFGRGGVLDLAPGADVRPGEAFAVTSPPVVFRDLVITGALAPEGVPRGPSGDVRAFDARTGREAWRFHTVPRPGEPGHETWPEDGWQRRTGVNVWSQMAVDHERGLVFLPTGSASYDFYGGDRAGQNLHASSLVALRADTGARVWSVQLVHHDLWDYDLPAQPILADLRRDGLLVPAVIQVTKTGLVFVFDRTTGEPVFGVEERPVPASDVPGEAAWRTQPFPLRPPPLVRTTALSRDELTRVTPESRRACEAIFDRVTSGGIFTPPGQSPTLWFPGTMGGATWSGGVVDAATGWLYVNTNEIGALGQMMPQPPESPIRFRRGGEFGEYGRFWDADRLPCQAPPWGRLHAVDLIAGDIAWQVPLGEVPSLAARGVTGTGTPNLGGAIATAGGLVFIGGANDRRFRAFDARTGAELWSAPLPASGHATPVTYLTPAGRQLVVIAAGGGGRFSTTVADAVVAFGLP